MSSDRSYGDDQEDFKNLHSLAQNEEIAELNNIKANHNNKEESKIESSIKEEILIEKSDTQKDGEVQIDNDNRIFLTKYNHIPKSFLNAIRFRSNPTQQLPGLEDARNKFHLPRISSGKLNTAPTKARPIPKPRPTSVNNKEYLLLNSENTKLRAELKNLNDQINKIISNKLSHNITEPKSVNKNLASKEKEIAQRLLNSLLIDYNTLFKKIYGSNITSSYSLKENISQIEKEKSEVLQKNKELKKKIKQNEYLHHQEATKVESKQNLKDLNSLDYKIQLYKNKIVKMRTENEKCVQSITKEEENYNTLVDKHNKLVEILEMYEVDFNKDDTDERKIYLERQEKIKKLKKKLDIVNHAKETMSTNYNQQIKEKQKYIEHIQAKIKELQIIIY